LCSYTQNYPIERVLDCLWNLKGREGTNSAYELSICESLFEEFLDKNNPNNLQVTANWIALHFT